MNGFFDRAGKIPAYLQLYRQLRKDIAEGNYPYASKLPSKRTLAENTGLSTVTVERAYALLTDEGYIEPKERSGYYVIFRPNDSFACGEYAEEDPAAYYRERQKSTFPFTVLAKAMRKTINDYGERLLEKSPNLGEERLREALRRYLARNRGIAADTEQIVIGSGAEYFYGMIVRLLGRERTYAIETPSYHKIEQVYRSFGVEFEKLPVGREGILSTALAASTADVLHTTPYRSFPSGATASVSKRYEYLRWAEEGGRMIVEDDFESEFSLSAKPRETLFALSHRDDVIYMNTFTQTVSPALRIGYMVLPKGLVGRYREKLGFYSCTVPTFEQFLLAELISSGDFERHVNRIRREKRRQEI